jgi:hypothetical protein
MGRYTQIAPIVLLALLGG